MTDRQCVYITGGSSGIGLGLARCYARAGSDVVLIARDQAKLDVAVCRCEDVATGSGQLVAGVSVDVTAYDSLPAELARVIAQYGLPDLLILSAGIAGNKRFLDTTAAEFDDIVDINLAGSREVARAFLPLFLQRGSGQLAFISSTAGLMGIYGYSAYSASKFAVTGLVQALRQELAGTGVSVHLVCPAEVDTPMIAAESPTAIAQTRFLKSLVGTMGPERVAGKIVRGLTQRKAVIVPGFRASVVVWTARHFPELFAKSCELLLRWKFG